MSSSLPRLVPNVLLSAGPFTPAETVELTGITESTLQNWTNKGYLGDDKLKLGRGARRRYTLADIETIMFGMDMVDAGIAPVVAFEYAPVVQQRTADAVEQIRTRLAEDGHDEASMQRELSSQVCELLACFEANPAAGTSADRVMVLRRGQLQFQHLPGSGKAVLLLRVGLRMLGLAMHHDVLEKQKHAKRAAARALKAPIRRMTRGELLAGLEALDAAEAEKGKP